MFGAAKDLRVKIALTGRKKWWVRLAVVSRTSMWQIFKIITMRASATGLREASPCRISSTILTNLFVFAEVTVRGKWARRKIKRGISKITRMKDETESETIFWKWKSSLSPRNHFPVCLGYFSLNLVIIFVPQTPHLIQYNHADRSKSTPVPLSFIL